MSKKYALIKSDSIVFNGVTLYRIKALRDIDEFFIKKGDMGGYVESKNNLSQDGCAWVYGNARVYGDALVSGDAWVYGNALVSGRTY